MCLECGIDKPICGYCGEECWGACRDPDTCITCWADKHHEYDVDDGGEALEECLDGECKCACHADLYAEFGIRFEAGVKLNSEDSTPPYKRQGAFPFFALPREIRDRIYRYAVLQDGEQRALGSHYHRGTIHTAVLQTCRQINKEARHFPLTINKLCFDGALNALQFFAFRLPVTVSHLVEAIHVEYHMTNPQSEVWYLLTKELAHMNITHLGLTIFGPVRKDFIEGHTCFTARFKLLPKLQSIDLTLGSAFVTEHDRLECLEYLKKQLIKVHKVSPKDSLKLKRTATDDKQSVEGEMSSKMSKKDSFVLKRTKHTRSSAAGDAKLDPNHHAQMQLQTKMNAQFTKLKMYAMVVNPSLVSIRLDAARKAMEAADQQKFESLAHGIWDTLESHYKAVSIARMNLMMPSHVMQSNLSAEASLKQESQMSLGL